MTTTTMTPAARDASPQAALDVLLSQLAPVDAEHVALDAAAGRVLAEAVVADRDSPPCDVSAMDGYAVRVADVGAPTLPVTGEAAIGCAPPTHRVGTATRIFTGGPIPPGADAVIRREDVDESPRSVALTERARAAGQGQSIRRRGENLRAGGEVLAAGTRITGPVLAALATFGVARPRVHRRVRVAVIVTGDELLPPDATPQPWQIRDSNTSAVIGGLAGCPWLDIADTRRVRDDLDDIVAAVAQSLRDWDAVILTGGVSMGDHDHVPDAVRRAGGEVVFHRLPIRPGKPVLAAIGPRGQVLFGLPGNPVSAQTTLRRFALPALAVKAGITSRHGATASVRIANADARRLALTWFRPVRVIEPGVAELIDSRGSGDMVASAHSDGFVEVPPDGGGEGPFVFFPWEAAP